jgi:hypothetical protein
MRGETGATDATASLWTTDTGSENSIWSRTYCNLSKTEIKQEIYEGRLEPWTQLFLSGQQKKVQRIVTSPEYNLSKTETKKEIYEERLEPRTQLFLSRQQKQVQSTVTSTEHNLSKTETKQEIYEGTNATVSLWTTETGSENSNRSRTQ